MMDNLLNNCYFLSAQTNRDLILYLNPVDNKTYVYVFLEFNHATANQSYHEMVGYDITDEFPRLNEHSFDVAVFEQRLEKRMKITLRTAEHNWVWLKAQLANQ